MSAESSELTVMRAIRQEADGSPHIHKSKVPSQQQLQQQQQGSSTVVTEPTSMKIINAKLDRIIALLESQQNKNG